MTLSNVGPGAFPPVDGSGSTGDTTRLRSIETWDSRTLNVTQGRRTRTREFVVYATDGSGIVVPSDAVAVQQTGVAYGDAHPEDPGLLALDVTVAVTPEAGRGALRVRFTYRRGELIGPEPEDPLAPDYQEVNLSGDGQFIDTYRDNAAVPDEGTVAPGRVDIGGEPIDVAGEPQSRLLVQGTYVISRNYPLSEYSAPTLLAAIGVRNQAPFLGFPAGSLLYGRPRTSRVAQGVVRVVHQLILDQHRFHLRQQAYATTEGKQLGTNVPGGEGGSHASRVYHVQPFPLQGDLEALNIVRPGTPL